MGIFDFLKRKGVNKDILRAEERKKQSEELKKKYEERNIEIELEKLAQEAELRKAKAVKEKTERELEKYLMSFDTNIICEDGVERKYSGNMYGIIEEVIVESSSIPIAMIYQSIFKTFKSKNDLPPRYGLTVYKFKKFWFSKLGKYLSIEEVLNLQKIQGDEHNYHLSNNNNYKNFFESKKAESKKHNIKRSLGLPQHLVINNINNIYYIKEFENFEFEGATPFAEKRRFIYSVGSLFDGTIDDVKYKNGIIQD